MKSTSHSTAFCLGEVSDVQRCHWLSDNFFLCVKHLDTVRRKAGTCTTQTCYKYDCITSRLCVVWGSVLRLSFTSHSGGMDSFFKGKRALVTGAGKGKLPIHASSLKSLSVFTFSNRYSFLWAMHFNTTWKGHRKQQKEVQNKKETIIRTFKVTKEANLDRCSAVLSGRVHRFWVSLFFIIPGHWIETFVCSAMVPVILKATKGCRDSFVSLLLIVLYTNGFVYYRQFLYECMLRMASLSEEGFRAVFFVSWCSAASSKVR